MSRIGRNTGSFKWVLVGGLGSYFIFLIKAICMKQAGIILASGVGLCVTSSYNHLRS
ncbi:hypothetical protein J2Z26_004321 [Bacillus luteolus]|nr:hypothetical protein [Cytobacillus luteolus]